MKVVLIQLPVQSPDYEYSRENIPLAAGYLAAYAAAAGFEVEICPPEVASLAGDAALLEWTCERKPDLVGFATYLWNSARVVYLGQALKQRLPDCRCLLGGPEVNPDNAWLLASGAFDYGIVGEGELGFLNLLRALMAGASPLGQPGLLVRSGAGYEYAGPAALLPELDAVPSPYLSGLIGPSFNRSLNLETVRGCPYTCSYCYYPKAFKGLRSFGLERLKSEFDWALAQGVNEINILDPSFARRPDILELLGLLKRRGLKLNCELNVEELSPELVAAFTAAGLAAVEIGLQTTNPLALKAVRRAFNPERFMRGVRLLRSSGVIVMTDVMLGLPGDSLADVKRTIDFVVENELYDSLGVYPLAVLPGTRLRSAAAELGLDYDPAPPYLLNASSKMDADELEAAFAYAAVLTATDYQPVIAPYQRKWAGAYLAQVEFGPGAWPALAADSLGQSLSCVITAADWPARLNELCAVLGPACAANPFTLLSLVLDEACFNLKASRDLLALVSALSAQQPPLYLRCALAQGFAYVRWSQPDSVELWCGLPPDAGAREEDDLNRRARAWLGPAVELVFHDLAAPAEF